jgi:hypothetical protein
MLNLLKKMINKPSQKQDAGDNSTNLQVQKVIVNQGISYSDAKEIANDVFKTNFIELKKEAAIVAQVRAEEITDKVISQLSERHPESINEFETPALQDALFTVQKQYAISGDDNLGDLLVDILVDRAAAPKKNMVQIVLDESLGVAPKLTLEQLDTLTFIFLLFYTRRNTLKDYEGFLAYFRKCIVPFIDKLSDKHSDYTHIEYLGCAHSRAGNVGALEDKLRGNYKAFLSTGFSVEELRENVDEKDNITGLIIPCFHNKEKLQTGSQNDDALDEISDENGINTETKQKLKQLFESSTMPANEVKKVLIEAIPEMEKAFEIWDRSVINRLELSSVGIAIAHANFRRKVGETMDLSNWIK